MLTNSKPVILIPTVKKQEAREFYENVLGLKFRVDDGFALVFDTAGIMLRLTPVEEFTPHKFSVLGWEVDDISKSVEGLVERGCNVSNDTTSPGWSRMNWEFGLLRTAQRSRGSKIRMETLLSVAQHA
jgi:predicted enzyme related to lactoylglutathione lyase